MRDEFAEDWGLGSASKRLSCRDGRGETEKRRKGELDANRHVPRIGPLASRELAVIRELSKKNGYGNDGDL